MDRAIVRKWDRLTNEEIAAAKGEPSLLVGIIAERYGISLDEAQKQMNEFLTGNTGERDLKVPEVAHEGAPVDEETFKIGFKT